MYAFNNKISLWIVFLSGQVLKHTLPFCEDLSLFCGDGVSTKLSGILILIDVVISIKIDNIITNNKKIIYGFII